LTVGVTPPVGVEGAARGKKHVTTHVPLLADDGCETLRTPHSLSPKATVTAASVNADAGRVSNLCHSGRRNGYTPHTTREHGRVRTHLIESVMNDERAVDTTAGVMDCSAGVSAAANSKCADTTSPLTRN
jgi:hypothetical protein